MWLDRASDRSLSLILFLSASFWGLYWVPLKALQDAGFNGPESVAIFNFMPLIALLPLLFFYRAGALHNWRASAVISVCIGLGLSCYAMGLAMSSVVRVTLLFYLTPIWGTAIGVFWLGETLTKGRIAAICLGLVGLYLLISGAHDSAIPIGLGDAFGLFSGLAWAVGSAALKKWPDTPVLTSTTGQFVFTVAFSGFLGLFFFVPSGSGYAEFAPVSLLITFAGLAILLPSFLLILSVCKRLFPGRAGLLMMSEVLVAILTASLFLPLETMNLVQWGGGGLIILACLVEIAVGEDASGGDILEK